MKTSHNVSNKQKRDSAVNTARKMVRTLRVLPILESFGNWKMTKSDEDDPLFSFENHDVQDGTSRRLPYRMKDAFGISEAFLAIRRPEDAATFFQNFGPMQLTVKGADKLRRIAAPVRFSQVLACRNFWIAASQGRIGRAEDESTDSRLRAELDRFYVEQPLKAELQIVSLGPEERRKQVPAMVIRCLDIEEVLRASIFLDKLNGLNWGLCAREKCGKPFRIGSHTNRIYCGPACARLQAQNEYLKRIAKNDQKTKHNQKQSTRKAKRK